MKRLQVFVTVLFCSFSFGSFSELKAASKPFSENFEKQKKSSVCQERSFQVDDVPEEKYQREKVVGVSPSTQKILARYWALEFPLEKDKYDEAKAIIQDAKKIYDDGCDLDKVNLRYVRFSLNLLLACENLKKDTYVSRRAADYYLAVALKDLTLGGKIFYSNRKQFFVVWKNVIADYRRITYVYSKEILRAGKRVHEAVKKITEILSGKKKEDEKGRTEKSS